MFKLNNSKVDEFLQYVFKYEFMKQMYLMKVSGDLPPTSPYRMDFHFSVVFALIRWIIPKLSEFEHKPSPILSIMTFMPIYEQPTSNPVPICKNTLV